MRAVKFLKAVGGYREGQVVEVDELSAAALVKRKDAEPVKASTPAADGPAAEAVPDAEGDAAPAARTRGGRSRPADAEAVEH